MHTLTLNVPDNIGEKEALMILASQLYGRAELSLGQAAELAGLPKRSFMESLGKYGVSAFNYTADEMKAEFRTKRAE